MKKCPHCERTEQQVKIGHNASGSQRYLCKVCRRKYTPVASPQVYSEAVRAEAVRLYVDGMNQRRIARTLGVSHQSVANWIKRHADSLPNQPPEPEVQPLEVNELDELLTFIGDKKTRCTS
jgi:insertion element IS1 protein InsB